MEIKEDKEIMVAQEAPTPAKTGREVVLERMRVKHPDIDGEDDEAIFGAINADYDEAEANAGKYAEANDALNKMLEVFESNPDAAALYVDLARGGKSVLEYLIEKYGDDFREALDDEEMRAKIVEAEHKYRETVAKDAQLKEEAKVNLEATLAALDEAADECGVGEEEKEAAFEAFVNMVDDAIRDKVSRDTWVMFIKGITHDSDVEDASVEGEVRGRNTRIREALKKPDTKMPPILGGQAGAPADRPQASYGGFLDRVKEGDWYTNAKKGK